MLMIKRKDAMISIVNVKMLVGDLERALTVFKEFNADPEKVANDIVSAEKGNIVSDAGIVIELKESFNHIVTGLKGDQTKSVAKQKGIDKLRYVINTLLNQINGFSSILDIVGTQVKVTKDNFTNVSENLPIESLTERIKLIANTDANSQYYLKRSNDYLSGILETTSVDKLVNLKNINNLSSLDILVNLNNIITLDTKDFVAALNDDGHKFEDFLTEYTNKILMVQEEFKSKELLGQDKLIKEPEETDIDNKDIVELLKTSSKIKSPLNASTNLNATNSVIASLKTIIDLSQKEVNLLISKYNFNLPNDKLNIDVLTKVVADALEDASKDIITNEELEIKLNNIIITFKNLFVLDEHLTDVAIHKLNVINSILTTYQQAYDLVVEFTNLGYVVDKQ